MTISGGTVYNATVGKDAEVTVNGGSLHAGSWYNDGTLNITGGTFSSVKFYNRAGTDDGKFHSESPSFLALQRRMNHCQMGSIPSSSRRSGCHWVASTRSPYS